ncbi:MAG: acyl carrier protein [Pirellulaceae bacterium]
MSANMRESIRQFILDEFLPGEDPEQLLATTPLITGGILDSLATLKMVEFLEKTFSIRIEAHEADVDNLDTLEKIVGFVTGKQNSEAT